MRKIFLVALLLAFLAVPFASAMFESTTTNNAVTSYGYPEIQIKSWFGLGGTVESLNLNYHTPQCLINCQSIEQVYLANDGQLIDGIRFLNIDGNVAEPMSYSVQYGYVKNFTREVADYQNVCNPYTSENGTYTNNCTDVQIGSHNESYSDIAWESYNNEVLPAGNYYLKIDAQKQIGQDLDWQVHSPLSGWLTEHAWFNTAWGAKKQIIYTELSNRALNNYPVKLNVTYAGLMNADFSDLRFTDSTETTEFSYWIESKVNSKSAIVWVNVTNIPSGGTTTGFMYYNNPGASTTSSGVNTFLFFDDFTGLLTKWNIVGTVTGNGSSTVGVNISGTGSYLQTPQKWSLYNITARTSLFPGETNLRKEWGFSNDTASGDVSFFLTNSFVAAEQLFTDGNEYTNTKAGTSTGTQNANGAYTTAQLPREVKIDSNTKVNFTRNDVQLNFHTTNDPNSAMNLFLHTRTGSMNVSWILIRNSTTPEPTASFGAEQLLLAVTLASPSNNTLTSNGKQTFSCIQNGTGLINNTLQIWNQTGSLVLFNLTLISNANNQTFNVMTLPYSGNFTWNCLVTDANTARYATNNFSITFDNVAPNIIIVNPANNSISITPSATQINFTTSDLTTNVNTCWYNVDGGANVTLANCVNSTFATIVGDHIFNLFANDTLNNVGSAFTNITIVNLSLSNISSASALETATQTFNQTINVSNSVQIISNGFFYNGSLYAGVQNSTRFDFGKTIQIPKTTDLVNGTHKFYWSFNLTFNGNSQILNSTTYDQFVHGTQLVLCNSSFAVPFVNYTFKDEVTNTAINNGTIPSSTLSFWVSGTDGVLSRTTIFSNNTMNPSYAFCGSPGFASFITNQTVSYASTQGATYPQRTYISLNSTLTNSTTNTVLYLLSSTAGQYVTFQVINSALAPIQGVEVIAQTTIGGSTVTVGHGFTDASGGVTMWLNPLASHTMTFEKTGYTTVSSTITPSQTSYTITMSQIGANNNTDYGQGINYVISPVNTYLSNGTTYNFNLTLTSTANTVTAWGFNITNSTGALMSSNSSSANGGFLSSSLNTYSNQSFVMYGYWTVNGVNSTFVKAFVIQDLSGTGYSILNLLSDFNLYVANGSFFGLDSFGLSLIIFLIIFTSTGILSYKFGIYSPAAIAGMIFVETAFFDIGLGLITPPAFVGGLHQGFATVFMFLIMVALAIKEATGY